MQFLPNVLQIQLFYSVNRGTVLFVFSQPLYFLVCIQSAVVLFDLCSVNRGTVLFVFSQPLYFLACIQSTVVLVGLYSVNRGTILLVQGQPWYCLAGIQSTWYHLVCIQRCTLCFTFSVTASGLVQLIVISSCLSSNNTIPSLIFSRRPD